MKNMLMVSLVLSLCGALSAAVPQRVLELPPSLENCRNSEGDFAVLKDGRVLFVYSHYVKGSGGDHDPAHLASRVSTDGGRTWSKESVEVVANEGGMNVMSVSMLRLKDGALALFYLRKNSETDCRPVMRVSRDEGKTWGEPVLCVPDTEKSYYVLNNCRATRLSSGRIVLPLSDFAPKDGRIGDWAGKLVCYFSDDEGVTWKRGRDHFATFDSEGRRVTTQEPGIVELKDGRVLMYARTSHGRQWFFHSFDGCDTWTHGAPGSLWGPCAPATVKRLSNGDLFAVWNDHENQPELAKLGPDWSHGLRTPLTLAISKDEGKTWINRRVLEGNPKGWYCYIAVRELDGNLLLGYCAMGMLRHSRITTVPLAWLYEPAPPCAPKCSASRKTSAFKDLKPGPFETLKTGLGTWTAATGHAAVFSWARGTGIRIQGGIAREVVLTLPKAQPSDSLKLRVERFTIREPYSLQVEARGANGVWELVYEEGKDTPVGCLREMNFRKLATPVTAYRFRCSSVLGAILGDAAEWDFNLNGFFND